MAGTRRINRSFVLLTAVILAAASHARASGVGHDGPPQEMCGLCHGYDGVSRMSKFPRLAGQKSAYIEKQLRDFLAGRRENDGGQMAGIVTEISEAQFAEAARYFSELEPPPPIESDGSAESASTAVSLVQDGDERRGIPACASCHMPQPQRSSGAIPEHAPYLSAQHPDYLVKQLRDFRDGTRENDSTGIMAAIAKALSDAEIDALGTYLASLPREVSHAN
jgi:cytochrome c553